jgi:hypothetical protein
MQNAKLLAIWLWVVKAEAKAVAGVKMKVSPANPTWLTQQQAWALRLLLPEKVLRRIWQA